MSSPVRRFLILATLFALLLGVAGPVAPVAAAGKHDSPPLSTRFHGIDVDATTTRSSSD